MLLKAEQRARNLPCNLNKEDVLKRFPIHYGVECGDVNVMNELLKWEDANINALDLYGFAPLHLAVRSTANHRTEVVEALLQVQNIDVNIASVTPSSDVQPLQMAGKNEDWLDLFFPFQPLEAPQESSTHLTPLHFAAKMGSGRIVDLLLQCPMIELNKQDSRHYTPLHFAAQNGHVRVVESFIEEGPGQVNFESRDNEDLTPVWRAIWNERMEVVRLLWDVASREEYDTIDILLPNLRTGDQNLAPARFLVGSFLTDKLIQVIEEMGNADDLNLEATRDNLFGRLETVVASPNSSRSQTLLHWVAKNNHWKLIPQIMIRKRQTGGFVNQMDFAQNTALHYAAKDGHGDVVKTLLAHASELDLNLKDSDGDTPLHLATKNSRVHVVKALCQNPDQQRLRANEEDAKGETCLQYATEHGLPKEIANTLMDRSDVKDFLDRHYRDRQVFVDAANALLVGGALIAGLSFASWLQPPLSFTPYYQFPQSTPATPPATYETFAAVELHYSLRLFWTFNNLSFFAIATVLSGAEAAFPDLDRIFVVKAVQIVRRALIWTSILLVFSVMTVLGAFVCAGYAVLPPIARDVNNMTISTVFGMLVCCVVLFKFSAKLFRSIFKIIKRRSEKL
jgi:ankyrin repeat protein